MGYDLANVENIADSGSLELDGAFASTTAVIDGKTYLIVAGNKDDGIQVFLVGGDGSLTIADSVPDDGTLSLQGVTSVTTAEVDGKTFLYATSSNDNGVSVFEVASNGTLSNVQNIVDDGNTELTAAYGGTAVDISGTTFYYVAALGDLGTTSNGGVSAFLVANDGSLSLVEAYADDGILNLNGATSVTSTVIGGTTYVFVSGAYDGGVSVFSAASDGKLTNVDNVDDGDSAPAIGPLPLAGAFSVATSKIGEATFLFVAGIADNGISVFSVANNGSLTAVDHVADSGDLELWDAHSLTTAKVNGVTLLFVAALSDDGFSVFSVADDGTLTNVDNVSDSGDLELDGATSVTTAVVNGTTFLFVTGDDDDGVSVFSVSETVQEVPGVNLIGTSARDVLSGGAGDDLIIGLEGKDDLNGEDGDDILIGNSGKDKLNGGLGDDKLLGGKKKDVLNGGDAEDILIGGKDKDKLNGGEDADAFVFDTKLKNKWADKITDFEVGIDSIHLNREIFKKVGNAGELKGKFFDTGKKADSGKDRVLYQENKGWLRYDKDGKGGADAVKFAKIGKNLDLSEDDFLVI